MSRVGEENALFISATQKNFEEFRERVYESVRQIHITRFPTTNSCIRLQRRGRRKDEEENE
jgi:GTP-binding protein HflX